jgi:serine/threonine protein kinase
MNAVTSASAAAPKQCPSCGNRYPVDALFCPIDGTPLSTTASSSAVSQVQDSYLGREILDHIEIKQLAGVGAMGRVYRAFQKGIDRDVAVKILHRELSSNQQLVARFLREAKVASRLQHPHVVHVHLAGQLPDGSMYMVMEYLDGMSLQSALAAVGGVMELPRALQITLALCDAVGEAHVQGVVHRDIKPENVMLVRRGEDTDYVKVLDFGIARLSWGDQSMATAAGLIFGTARYISPEGAQGEVVGPQSDVYGIATLLFQMLSGRTPFEGEQAVGLLIQQIHDQPPELRSIPRASYVPEPIARAIMRNLAKRPEARDADARVLGRALVDAARESGLSPDDLMPRSVLLGRGSGPMQIASMQRTRQLRLDAETSAKMAAPRTSFEPPPRPTPDPASPTHVSAAPANATTKWSPPADVKARMEVSFPPPRTSSVDATLDDGDVPKHPPYPTVPTPLPTPIPRTGVPPSSHPSKPPSGVGSTLGDADAIAPPRRARSRAAVLVFFCFLLGVIVATTVAFKLGLVTSAAPTVTRDHQVALAHAALIHQEWETPPGDNVRDLTTDGLARWPNDLEFLRIRALACDEIIRVARESHHVGDLANALHLVKLAHELDPSDEDAARLSGEWQTELDDAPSMAPLASVDGGATPVASAKPKSISVSVDVVPPHPRAGQPVDFVARVVVTPAGAARPAIDKPVFQVTGAGVPNGARVAAACDDAGVCRASYSLASAGRVDVTFVAKAGAQPLRSARMVQVAGDATAPPTPQPSASDPMTGPAPSGSTGKWL